MTTTMGPWEPLGPWLPQPEDGRGARLVVASSVEVRLEKHPERKVPWRIHQVSMVGSFGAEAA